MAIQETSGGLFFLRPDTSNALHYGSTGLSARTQEVCTVSADYHIHTKYSKDCKVSPFDLVDRAKAIGLKVISITDHNSVGAYRVLGSYPADNGVLLLPGMELSTPGWHVLIVDVPPDRLDMWREKHGIVDGSTTTWRSPKLEDVLKFVRDEGGKSIAAHPGLAVISMSFGMLRRAAEDGLIHGVEVHNGEFRRFFGRQLYNIWHEYVLRNIEGLKLTRYCNSDAHCLEDIGSFSNTVAVEGKVTRETVLEAMRSGTVYEYQGEKE